jgi:hypothetical protein
VRERAEEKGHRLASLERKEDQPRGERGSANPEESTDSLMKTRLDRCWPEDEPTVEQLREMVRMSIQDRALVHGAEAQLGSLYGTTLRLAAISMDICAGITDLEDSAGIVEGFQVERLNGHMRGTRTITPGYCSLTSVKRSPTGNSQ